MRLLLDMDSVLVQLMPYWLRLYNAEYNDNLTMDKITAWDMARFVKPECGNKIYEYLNQPGAFRDLEPMPHGPETVKALLEDGHEIFIVTAPPVRSSTAMWDKLEWVREHLPFFPEHHVIFCHPKYVIHGDILFDDSPINLAHFARIGVAMDYNYNKEEGVFRVNSWPEFKQLVDSLSKDEEGTIRDAEGRVLYTDGKLTIPPSSPLHKG